MLGTANEYSLLIARLDEARQLHHDPIRLPLALRFAFHWVHPSGGNNWQLLGIPPAIYLPPRWGKTPTDVFWGECGGSCQSWLHRHKAGGGPTLR
ncbi:MAG: hypothetical protein FJ308_22935 [Planctomycetes bacterium]|nr:hypothetical protein [Planctomycetota bacterium]